MKNQYFLKKNSLTKLLKNKNDLYKYRIFYNLNNK